MHARSDGRDGWCPGEVVEPLIFDVSRAVSQTGVHSVTYNALSYFVGGGHPSADGCGGDIFYSGVLLFYPT